MKHITRGGEFIIQDTDCEAVFIPEEFSEEQQMMQSAVIEFIDREAWPQKERIEKKDYALIEEIMRKAGQFGFLGVSVPEKYDGLGMGFVSAMLVCDHISGASGSLATAFGAHTGIGTLPILLYGTETQKKNYIPRLASGEWFGAYCLTEPGAGSDANSGKTKAVLSEDGTHYKINGQKMWITNAGFCHLMIVFARIEDDKNISSFIVEYDPQNPNGITLGEEEHKLGIRSSSTRQVFFNDTVVPVENMLSDRGKGFKIAVNALNAGRIKLAAACIDAQRRTISKAVKYAKERIQFDKSIAEFGAIKAKLAEMATRCYASESGCYRAAKDIENSIAARVAEGSARHEAELKGFEEYAVECAILKVHASESIQYCSDEGIQILGGMGFSEETPMESTWRDARITRIYEGTNEINRLLTVGMLLRKATKGQIDLLGPAMKIADELLSIPSFDIPDYSALFSEEKELLSKLKKATLMIAGKAVQKFGNQLEENQQLLLAIADMLIEIYLAESTILRTEKLSKKNSESACKAQIAMSKLNLYNAVEKITAKGKESIISFVENDEQRMMLTGLKRFTKYTHLPNVFALRKEIADALSAEGRYCF